MNANKTQLTERQRECVGLYARGELVKGIGEIVGISQKTVEFHLCQAKRALGIFNNALLVRWAISEGLSPLETKFFPR